MELVETKKEGYCAVCGAKISEYDYKVGDIWIEDFTCIYKPFVCGNCGMSGEDVFYIEPNYIGTNGWKPIED